MSPQISKVDLYVGGELLSPIDDKRLIGKCNFPDRVVRFSRSVMSLTYCKHCRKCDVQYYVLWFFNIYIF